MNFDEEYVSFSNVHDETDIFFKTQAYQYQQSLQTQAQTSRMCNVIFRERELAEERLWDDYFGDSLKYPEYYFKSKKLCCVSKALNL